jgi:general stress protein YciG
MKLIPLARGLQNNFQIPKRNRMEVINMAQNQGNKRGFAVMDDEKQREISSKGGKASSQGNKSGGSSRGGSSEQHREAGKQSHKNR